MPRFNVSIEFDLETRIDPDGIRFDTPYDSEVEDFEDESYFQGEDVTTSGGRVTFVVIADSEEQAYEKAAEVVNEGSEVEDDNSFTWVVSNLNTEVEEIEEPMTMERAEAILIGLAEGQSDPAVKEAVEFVFDRLGGLEARLAEATQRIDGLVARVERAEAPTEAVESA